MQNRILPKINWDAIASIILLITACAIGWQAHSTKKLIDLQKESSYLENRAYITIEKGGITVINNKLRFTYELKNYGKTPAFEVGSAISRDISKEEVINAIKNKKYLSPQASYTDFIDIDYNYEELKDKKLQLYIRYNDYLNKAHIQIMDFLIGNNGGKYIFDITEHKET